MADLREYLPLEKRFNSLIISAWNKQGLPYLLPLENLVNAGEYDKALHLVDSIQFDIPEESIRAMASDIMVNGAERVSGLSSIHNINYQRIINSMVDVLRRNIDLILDDLKIGLRNLVISNNPNHEASKGDKVYKGNTLREFVSFNEPKDAAQRLLEMESSLHSTRLSNMGYLMEAMLNGVTTYAISEQLDSRICDVCIVMHGRQFSVSNGYLSVDKVLNLGEDEDIRTVAPWPKQDKKSVKALASMSESELLENNQISPPFHPLCRGLLVNIDDVQDIRDKPTYQEALQLNPDMANYTPYETDFIAVGLDYSDEIGMNWNQINTPPRDYVAELTDQDKGTITKDWLDKNKVIADLTPDTMVVDSNIPMQGSTNPIGLTTTFHFGDTEGKVSIDKLTVADVNDLDAAKKVLDKLTTYFKDLGVKRIAFTAGADFSSYALAMYGIVPSSWDSLYSTVNNRLKDIKNQIPPDLYDEILGLINNGDNRVVSILADLKPSINGKTLGEYLLGDLPWEGYLDVNDITAWDRFKYFFGS